MRYVSHDSYGEVLEREDFAKGPFMVPVCTDDRSTVVGCC